ncbi:hypothetical protein [Zunongwangia profunda]|uniref:hypothetical protein n=1 Tax=Zunongwangia profunda TaxID=398743 RepID=UPI000C9295F3|nr:hypothetical protein [Zunongwangia profunda]MAG88877.1 hypothetical protein [Flavobacteriaceae bacterium]MCC4227414.1 hypothetical protein [Zunongwangia profunda]|tara:strand:- start:2441 stop:2686 length:246 start_codon:yes stop_codon:yes gene_type:complete
MDEYEVMSILKDLREGGKIPKDFDGTNSDFHKAIKYIMENERFDYEDFLAKKPIVEFGLWIPKDFDVLKEMIGTQFMKLVF